MHEQKVLGWWYCEVSSRLMVFWKTSLQFCIVVECLAWLAMGISFHGSCRLEQLLSFSFGFLVFAEFF